MIDDAGTTAAGLTEMKHQAIAAAVEAGLHAAYDKARSLGSGSG